MSNLSPTIVMNQLEWKASWSSSVAAWCYAHLNSFIYLLLLLLLFFLQCWWNHHKGYHGNVESIHMQLQIWSFVSGYNVPYIIVALLKKKKKKKDSMLMVVEIKND